MFLVFYRLLKENCGFYVEVLISDEKCKSLLERSSLGQPQSSANSSRPNSKREYCVAEGSLMPECNRAHQVCDRVHTFDLGANFILIKIVNPSFRPINT
jgi:hypothetical protein